MGYLTHNGRELTGVVNRRTANHKLYIELPEVIANSLKRGWVMTLTADVNGEPVTIPVQVTSVGTTYKNNRQTVVARVYLSESPDQRLNLPKPLTQDRDLVSGYDGLCGVCGENFLRGGAIKWRAGLGSWHASCPAPVLPTGPARVDISRRARDKKDIYPIGKPIQKTPHSTAYVPVWVSVKYIKAEDAEDQGLSGQGYYTSAICRVATKDQELDYITSWGGVARLGREKPDELGPVEDPLPDEGDDVPWQELTDETVGQHRKNIV